MERSLLWFRPSKSARWKVSSTCSHCFSFANMWSGSHKIWSRSWLTSKPMCRIPCVSVQWCWSQALRLSSNEELFADLRDQDQFDAVALSSRRNLAALHSAQMEKQFLAFLPWPAQWNTGFVSVGHCCKDIWGLLGLDTVHMLNPPVRRLPYAPVFLW